MKSVLVASDLTPRSVEALERGLVLGKQIGAVVHVLHVVDRDLPAAIAQHQRSEAERQLQEWLAASPHAADVTAHVEVVLGHRVASVLTATEAKNVELLILGSKRKSPLREVLTGGTFEQLLRLAKCPVLVVSCPPAAPYQRMLAAVDFSNSSHRAIEYATNLLPQAEIDLVHVYAMSYSGLANLNQEADSAKVEQHLRNMVAHDKQRFLAALEASGLKKEIAIRPGNVLTTIPEEIARRSTDLLVIGTHGRRGVARAILGSVASRLSRNPACDVLVVR